MLHDCVVELIGSRKCVSAIAVLVHVCQHNSLLVIILTNTLDSRGTLAQPALLHLPPKVLDLSGIHYSCN